MEDGLLAALEAAILMQLCSYAMLCTSSFVNSKAKYLKLRKKSIDGIVEAYLASQHVTSLDRL